MIAAQPPCVDYREKQTALRASGKRQCCPAGISRLAAQYWARAPGEWVLLSSALAPACSAEIVESKYRKPCFYGRQLWPHLAHAGLLGLVLLLVWGLRHTVFSGYNTHLVLPQVLSLLGFCLVIHKTITVLSQIHAYWTFSSFDC